MITSYFGDQKAKNFPRLKLRSPLIVQMSTQGYNLLRTNYRLIVFLIYCKFLVSKKTVVSFDDHQETIKDVSKRGAA